MFDTVPEKFLTGIDESLDITDAHSSTQLPQPQLVEVPRRVGLYIGLHMKLLVELLKEDAFHKLPSRGMAHGVHVPALRNNAVFDHARVADQRVHTVCGHHRGGILWIDGTGNMLLRLAARKAK